MLTKRQQHCLKAIGIDVWTERGATNGNHSAAESVPDILSAATPAYSSMQVLTGEDPAAADDVFSLACLAYRLIAGYRVFGPRNAAEAAEAGMEPQRLENMSNAQWQALRKALSYSRVARFSSPSEFISALTEAKSAGSVALGSEPDFRDQFDEPVESCSSGGR